jgi:hypothetical protein
MICAFATIRGRLVRLLPGKRQTLRQFCHDFFHFDPVVTNSGYMSNAVHSLATSEVVCTKYLYHRELGIKDGKVSERLRFGSVRLGGSSFAVPVLAGDCS